VASESSRENASGSSHCDSLNGSTPLMPRPTSGMCLARVRSAESDSGLVSESTCFLKRFFRLSLGIFDFRLVDPVPLKRLVSESRLMFGLRCRLLQDVGGEVGGGGLSVFDELDVTGDRGDRFVEDGASGRYCAFSLICLIRSRRFRVVSEVHSEPVSACSREGRLLELRMMSSVSKCESQ